MWRWQPNMRYHMVDEGAFSDDDLAARDTLPALLFRLESSPDPAGYGCCSGRRAWWRGSCAIHGIRGAGRSIFAELLGSLMGPLAPGMVVVPEELLEVRNMLATRAETWKQQWLQEGRQEGEQRGRREGEAALLVRQLERRFGVLPGWARDRVATGDTGALEEWGVRVLDASSLEDVLR